MKIVVVATHARTSSKLPITPTPCRPNYPRSNASQNLRCFVSYMCTSQQISPLRMPASPEQLKPVVGVSGSRTGAGVGITTTSPVARLVGSPCRGGVFVEQCLRNLFVVSRFEGLPTDIQWGERMLAKTAPLVLCNDSAMKEGKSIVSRATLENTARNKKTPAYCRGCGF